MKEWNKCPGCQSTTDGRSGFCPQCGEPLVIKCSSCGLTWRFWEGHKFCPTCGTPAEARAASRVEGQATGPSVSQRPCR